MHIRTNTTERLVLESRPWLQGLLLAFFFAVCASGAVHRLLTDHPGQAAILAIIATFLGTAFALAVERVWLVLDRTTGTAELRIRRLRGLRTKRFPLAALRGVEVEADTDRWFDNHIPRYRAVLTIDGERHAVPMTCSFFLNAKPVRRGVEAAQRWLDGARRAA